MDQKLSLSQSGVFNLLATAIGLGLLVALAFSLNALFASRTRQPSQMAKQPEVEKQLDADSGVVEEPSSAPTVAIRQTDPTASWKVYSNSRLHLSLKFPDEWQLHEAEEEIDGASYANINLETPGFRYGSKPNRFNVANNVAQGALLSINISPLESPTRQEKFEKNSFVSIASEEKVFIGGRFGAKYVWVDTDPQAGNYSITTFVVDNGKEYRFDFIYNQSERARYTKLFNLVLSTVQFE